MINSPMFPMVTMLAACLRTSYGKRMGLGITTHLLSIEGANWLKLYGKVELVTSRSNGTDFRLALVPFIFYKHLGAIHKNQTPN